jgi:FlaA1/EpsC-like NDP-sugar epimerase
MHNVLNLIGRQADLFADDVEAHEAAVAALVRSARVLVIGGAGSIGQAVTREIFRRNPRLLHVVDISENNLVELVRDLRSSLGYTDGEFATFAIDCGSDIFDAFLAHGPGYDYVLNLSALKHVRSERDPFTLMRMIEVNILNTCKTARQAREKGARKYFCVSTDKAANPVSMMGASKRIMEMFLMRCSLDAPVSTARFANVAFSDGSLLYGFDQRMAKDQPLAAPADIRRYFLTAQESGELCLLSCFLGDNRDLYFPKLEERLHAVTLSQIAVRYLLGRGYEPVLCATEDEARRRVGELKPRRKWPVHFFPSDTSGEKECEEFFAATETVDMTRYRAIGIVRQTPSMDPARLDAFMSATRALRQAGRWTREDLVAIFKKTVDGFQHSEKAKSLDQRM